MNLHRFDVKTIKNVELRRKTFKTTQNYESHQITMNCIDLMSKTSNQRKTTKVILFRWISIDLTSKLSKHLSKVAKLQKQSNYNGLHRFDVKTIKNVELRRKTFKTTQNYKRNQITMNCIDLTSERSKMLRYVAKLQMWSYYDEFASIWRQNDHNNAKLRNWSNYNALHQFDIKTI